MAAARTWHPGLLDPTERERRAWFRRDQDRDRFTVAAALLRLAVGRRLGVAAAEIEVDRTCPSCGQPHGAPRLPGRELFASISHSADRVAVAVASAPVGVDVEQLVELDIRPLVDTVLHANERVGIDHADGFLTVWTRKEAVLKAIGDGLRRPMTEVTVSAPDQPAALLGIAGRPDVIAQLQDLRPGHGYVGALALLGPGTVVRELDATQLLTAEPEGSAGSAG